MRSCTSTANQISRGASRHSSKVGPGQRFVGAQSRPTHDSNKFSQASRIFREWAQLPLSEQEFQAKQQALQEKHFPSTRPLPGAGKLLTTLAATSGPHIQLALATSSHRYNFNLKTEHLQDFFSAFPPDHKILGDDPRIPAGRGKPAPDIYLVALEAVNKTLRAAGEKEIFPEECLVFEDSVPGVESGRRAGMQVVWCPHQCLLTEYTGREQDVLAGLTGEHKGDEGQDAAAASQPSAERTHARVRGRPGEISDGWGLLVKSLVDFPYERYGIETGAGVSE